MSFVTFTPRRAPFGLALALLLTLPPLTPASGTEYPLRSAPVVDGVVVTMRTVSDRVYLGGWFTQVGERTGNTARIDLVTGEPDPAWPAVCGAVRCSAPDGEGGWFIGGDLIAVGQHSRSAFAHIRADGSLDPWDPGVNGSPLHMIVQDSKLYLCGSFTQVGGQPRNGVAQIDLVTHTVTAWNPAVSGLNSYVDNFAIAGSTLYLVGYFDAVGGQPRTRLAAVNAQTGAPLSWSPGLAGPNNATAIATDGSRVYLGGWFTGLTAYAQKYLVAVDAVTGAPIAWNPAPNLGIDHIAVTGGKIYVGGPFTQIGGQPRNCVAAFDAATGALTSWNPDVQGNISGIVPDGNLVYVSGNFAVAGGQPRRGIAAIDAVTGQATPWNPNTNGDSYTMGISSGTAFIGGVFSGLKMRPRVNLAAFDGASGALLPWSVSTDQEVDDMTVLGTTLYVAGPFSHMNGQPRSGLAAFDLSTGALLPWNPSATGRVSAIAATPTAIYAGGSFTTIGGQPRDAIAALDPVTGVATPWNPGANGWVGHLLASGGTLFVSGEFTTLAGQSRTRMGSFDLATGALLPFAPGPNGFIRGMARGDDGKLFVSGEYTSIGGQAREGLSALDSQTGAATAWYPARRVQDAIAVFGPNVYASGGFRVPEGTLLPPVAGFDAVTGALLPWTPHFGSTGYNQTLALATHSGRIYAGGWMMAAGFGTTEGLLAYDAVGDTTAPTAHVLAPNGGEEVFVGQPLEITWTASDDVALGPIALKLSRGGPSGPWETIASGLANSGHFTWTVTGPVSVASAYVRVDVTDAAGHSASDASDAAFTITTMPVPTLIELFRAYTTDGGVRIEWRAKDSSALRLERGATEAGEWLAVDAPVTRTGEQCSVLDARADATHAAWYRLTGVLAGGATFTSAPIPVLSGAPVTAFALSPPAPNPFVNHTRVSFALPVRAHVRLSLLDVQGREVARLVDGEREPGRHMSQLDASDLRAGIYYLRLEAPGVKLTQRTALLH